MSSWSSFNVRFVTANKNLKVHDVDEDEVVDENKQKKKKIKLNTSIFQSTFQNAYPIGFLVA